MAEKQTSKDALFEELSLIGLNAKKQYRIGDSLVALAFPNQKAAIEVDDISRERPEVKAADEKRDAVLKSKGWTVLRLRAKDVDADPTKAATDVEHFVGDAPDAADDPEEKPEPISENAAEINALVKAVQNLPARTQTSLKVIAAKNKTPVKAAPVQKPAKITETKIRPPKVSAAKINAAKKGMPVKAATKALKNKPTTVPKKAAANLPKKSAKHPHKGRKINPWFVMARLLLIGAAVALLMWIIVVASGM